jgi:hypothetical protein
VTAACDRPEGAADRAGPLALTAVLGTSPSIATVKDLAVLPDGAVWLLNSIEPFFIGFDASGQVLGTRGAAGGGPEEFRRPAAFVAGGLDGEAWVLDPLRHVFIRVSEPDEEWAPRAPRRAPARTWGRAAARGSSPTPTRSMAWTVGT